ncbi:cell wall hydrolase [Chitinibacter sp. SCUT-21]|uniref:cell wall hydrolase n=1 Tax=Chitinibacter sp. SCUT-21 TaxID=2970891 RepID=UPI0035A5CC0D
MSTWKQIYIGCLALFSASEIIPAAETSLRSKPVLASKIAGEYQNVSQKSKVSKKKAKLETRLSDSERNILILNAFNEARGESTHGIKAVLGVTMARVASSCYPDSVQAVVYQRKQFSWTHQKGSARNLTNAARMDAKALHQVKSIVDQYIADGAKPSKALLYHATHVKPKWTKSPGVTRVKRVGSHLFYDLKNC